MAKVVKKSKAKSKKPQVAGGFPAKDGFRGNLKGKKSQKKAPTRIGM